MLLTYYCAVLHCQTLKSLKVRVSVIGLSAEVRVCTVLTRETGGSYHIILDESHFKELLMLHVKPPPASSSSECSLIRMGEYTDVVSNTPLAVTKELKKHQNKCLAMSCFLFFYMLIVCLLCIISLSFQYVKSIITCVNSRPIIENNGRAGSCNRDIIHNTYHHITISPLVLPTKRTKVMWPK